MLTCSACGGELMDMDGRMVCIRCFTVNESANSDKDQIKILKDTDRSPNYRETDDECF